jgi:rhodanese-related sulfurtransferase
MLVLGFSVYYISKCHEVVCIDFVWCPICGGDFEEKGGKIACASCNYQALPADPEISIDPSDAKSLLETGNVQLVDVRTVYERMSGQIPGSELIPINELRERLEELDKKKIIIAYCQHGIRSFHAAQFLRQQGFVARSIKGGLEAWN